MVALHHFTQLLDNTAFLFIVFKHPVDFAFIVTRDTIGQNMNGVTCFAHIVAGGFNTGNRIRSSDVKFINLISIDKISKRLACQRISFCFCENVIRYDFHIFNQFGATRAGFKGSCAG